MPFMAREQTGDWDDRMIEAWRMGKEEPCATSGPQSPGPLECFVLPTLPSGCRSRLHHAVNLEAFECC